MDIVLVVVGVVDFVAEIAEIVDKVVFGMIAVDSVLTGTCCFHETDSSMRKLAGQFGLGVNRLVQTFRFAVGDRMIVAIADIVVAAAAAFAVAEAVDISADAEADSAVQFDVALAVGAAGVEDVSVAAVDDVAG